MRLLSFIDSLLFSLELGGSLQSVLGSSGLLFLVDLLKSDVLVSLLVDRLDEDSLVFELVTLGSKVEFVVPRLEGWVTAGSRSFPAFCTS